ncbi:hypothetical protein JI739_06415 [Ramlibacter sp. AW1]|uniref:Uncharacterized protein n=1 Tax=Ramlibacter aurantiacus TaxID=2801330 RepID=A0A937D6L5_9BURK|nr:hypothetical protein [Ramlibacter aurantiacus]MBL0419976.1 hypothetical protein [Ramlibacter aurantiacus]
MYLTPSLRPTVLPDEAAHPHVLPLEDAPSSRRPSVDRQDVSRPLSRRVSVSLGSSVEFDAERQVLPRPSVGLYRQMRRLDPHYDRGVRRMNWQKCGDGITNAAAASLATSLAAWNPAMGISVFSVVTAVETGIAIFTNARQAYELDLAEAYRSRGLPQPGARQQQIGRSLAASGGIDTLSSLLVVAGLAAGEELGPWFMFAMLAAYKLVQSNNSMAEVGQWRCRIRSSTADMTQQMLRNHQRYVDAVEMGMTTGIYSTCTMTAFVLLELLRGHDDEWFKWVAVSVALAGGVMSGLAKWSFSADAAPG